ncbi:MAG: GNAT family N-acetyltransferase [Chloroflexi bacterium]|nr:GNAT family N-acetyltransferase [Chloroflexota bacterium]
MNKIRFRRLRELDLPLMHRWLNTDFVNQWYGKKQHSYAEVREKYLPRINGKAPTFSFLILYSDIPIGYIQTYKLVDYPDYSNHLQVDENAAGVDLFIGEREYIHKGLGCVVLSTFLQEIVFVSDEIDSCVVGPEPKNTAAIRCYEKTGFRYLKTVHLPDESEPEYLMRIDRAMLAEGLIHCFSSGDQWGILE